MVAKGYSQVPGIDFGDIFSPIAKVNSIRLILSVAGAFYFEAKRVLLVKVDTLKNVSDAMTNFVSAQKFSWCREKMGVAKLG